MEIGQYLIRFWNDSRLGGAVVERWTRDRKVAGSTPGRGAIKSTRSTQPSSPPGYVNRVSACMAGVKVGCVHLCRVEGNNCVIPYGKWHSVAESWNTSINGYTRIFTFYVIRMNRKWNLAKDSTLCRNLEDIRKNTDVDYVSSTS